MQVLRFSTLPSTNLYCESLAPQALADGTCIWAEEQTSGIGQRGNHWHSTRGEGLTFSLVLCPPQMAASNQFALTQMLSLAMVDTLATLGIEACIKWPNDIYVGNRKICGMLVSNRVQGAHIAASICGIGLNVNQSTFPQWVPNPTSVRMLTGQQHSIKSVLDATLQNIERRYAQLLQHSNLEPEYLRHLMRLGTEATYVYGGQQIVATITGVDSYGRLLLATPQGTTLCCGMKEVAYVIG